MIATALEASNKESVGKAAVARRREPWRFTEYESACSLVVAGWMTLRGSWAVDLWFVTFTPWRLFYLVCGLPSLLCGTLFYFTPESPKFLLTRGKKGDTMKILQRVHSVNSGKLPHTFPVESVSMDTDEISPPARGKGIVGALKHIGNQTLPVFKPPYLRNLSLCIVIAFISFLCVNGVYLWLPEVTNRIAQYKDTHEGRFYVCEMLKKGPAANVTSVSEEHSGCQISSHTAVFVPSLLVATVQPFIILIASTVVTFIDRRIIISKLLGMKPLVIISYSN
ncbi:hypothetical protein J6590_070650 [Homalodisca vitripennis]|nr:hypothetical protein J6590_070650 [Homalodisca vitripennis]